MLPKVSRDELLAEVPQTGNGLSQGLNDFKFRMMSAVAARGHGKRALSTKSAHLTTVPLDMSFISSREQQKYNHLKPYFPYSGKTSSPIRAQKQQHNQQSALWKWRTSEVNGYQSDYSYNRVRAHSVRSAKGTETEAKPMPYLVPRTANSSRPTKVPLSPERTAGDPNGKSRTETKIIKAKPLSAAPGPTPTQSQNVEPPKSEFGEMVMMGSGKGPGIVNTSIALSSKVQATRERVHVCRTKEERDKNPESIRLDKNGIRVFPEIGGGESVTLKLLSLQHNLITRLENVPLLSQLVVLDLYDNRVERITGLQGLPSLRVLLLGKNRIKRIEGLESLKRLEILDLHGNQLRYVDNLGPLTSLRVLNLAGNVLRNIRNLGPYGMSSLTELNLKRNRIKNLDGLQKAPHLKRLLIANNDLQTVATLAPLRKLQFLRELVIDPNPMISATCVGAEYRNQIMTLFPNLSSLDRNTVTEEMRGEAKTWHKKKLAEEEARKQEELRQRDEIASKVGPPGSREQVIYQARRRWESLKNYVKNTNDNSEAGISHVKTPQKKLKNMKSVVVTATSGKPLAPDILYPPSTLDLEPFPDGHLELEQTESLLGCGVPNDDDEKEEIGRDSKLSRIQDSSSPEHEESQGAPPQIKSVLESNNDNKANEIIPSPTNPQMEHERDHTEVAEKQAYCTNTKSAFDALPSPGSSDREKSARVAVVRPLVRETPCNDQQSQAEERSATLNEPNDGEIVSTHFPGNGELSLYSPSAFSSPVKYLLPESELNFEDQYGVNFEDGKDENFGVIYHSHDGRVEKMIKNQSNNQDKSANEMLKTGESRETANSSSTTPTQNIRSKLLKHLRSVSLDSYPHQFFQQQPGQEKAEEESIQLLSDENGEEDDDNDNEVQDYDCDDAYSIATSTTTTGTSGSTPGRNSTVICTTNRILKGGSGGSARKQTFPRTKSQRIKIRDRVAKLQQNSADTSRSIPLAGRRHSIFSTGTGSKGAEGRPGAGGRVLRRCDSAASLSTGSGPGSVVNGTTISSGHNLIKTIVSGGGGSTPTVTEVETRDGPTPIRKQGVDFLVEIEGKVLNVFGQGGLRHALTAFTTSQTCHVCTAKFHYIAYDSIIPLFGKLRQVFPSLEHFHFRANNICTLAQLDALSDLQGLTSLSIAKEGNPIASHQAWPHYASYRLSHWGLQVINGKEVCSEYRGGVTPAAQAKGFESLGFLALSCLPQTALTPLAKRLHMLHCFCCCSPSTSSDESSRPQRLLAVNSAHNINHARAHSPSQQTEHGPAGNFCTAWDDDPVLLDVIGKEALVYCPPPPLSLEGDNNGYFGQFKRDGANEIELKSNPNSGTNVGGEAMSSTCHERKRAETLGDLIYSGVEIVEKVDKLEKVWPTLLTEVIQEMLMDFRFMDTYMKKELKKAQDITLINHHHHGSHSHSQHVRKPRH